MDESLPVPVLSQSLDSYKASRLYNCMPSTLPNTGPSTYIILNEPIPRATAGFSTPLDPNKAAIATPSRSDANTISDCQASRAIQVPKDFGSLHLMALACLEALFTSGRSARYWKISRNMASTRR